MAPTCGLFAPSFSGKICSHSCVEDSQSLSVMCSEPERERVVRILMDQPSLASALPDGRAAAAASASVLEVRSGLAHSC